MRKLILGAAIAALAAAPAIVIQSSASADDAGALQESGEQQFVVVYTEGVSLDAAHAAVAAAGGTIVAENTDVGVATVVTTNGDFAAAAGAQDALEGTAQNRVIGAAPELVVDAGEGRSSIRPRPTCSSTSGALVAGAGAADTATERRAARRPAMGHAADRRHRRRLVPVEKGKRACSSASSTPASTARTPTSLRTSTRS